MLIFIIILNLYKIIERILAIEEIANSLFADNSLNVLPQTISYKWSFLISRWKNSTLNWWIDELMNVLFKWAEMGQFSVHHGNNKEGKGVIVYEVVLFLWAGTMPLTIRLLPLACWKYK